MNPIQESSQAFIQFLKDHFKLDDDAIHSCHFTLNTDPHKKEFGDLNSNAPMVLAKIAKRNPRIIAQEIIDSFKHPAIERIEIAGPGFLNAWISAQAYQELAKQLYKQQEEFFKLPANIPKKKYDIEFVSANPTGPLHLGHGRGGIIGDVLGTVLRFLGHQVTKEFYVNDAGNQIAKLGASFKARCLQALGIQAAVPEDGYQGEYLLDLAHECIKEYGSSVSKKSDDFFEHYAKTKLQERIKKTLEHYGIYFDVWFSEKTLHTTGAIQEAIKYLQEHNHIYEKDGALWFNSTAFGDDKDRVVKKSTGEFTYVAADIAYLRNKAQRGFDHLIMVLGHDHHSYVTRLQGLLRALNLGHLPLDIILYQLVTMKASGQLVQMSKRAGTMVTLQEVIDEVGTDVARFFYLNRKADAQLEFDLDLALKKTEENPVYYVQYAYVRTGSILQKAQQESGLQNITDTDAAFLGESEHLLLKKIASLKQVLETIADHHQTHILAYYMIELADLFHKYYAHARVIDPENIKQSRARLLLIQLLRSTFQLGLTLLGISQPEKM